MVDVRQLIFHFSRLRAILYRNDRRFVVGRFSAFFRDLSVHDHFRHFSNAFRVVRRQGGATGTLFTAIRSRFHFLLRDTFPMVIRLNKRARVFVLLLLGNLLDHLRFLFRFLLIDRQSNVFHLFILQLFFHIVRDFLGIRFFFLRFFFFEIRVCFYFLFVVSGSRTGALPD